MGLFLCQCKNSLFWLTGKWKEENFLEQSCWQSKYPQNNNESACIWKNMRSLQWTFCAHMHIYTTFQWFLLSIILSLCSNWEEELKMDKYITTIVQGRSACVTKLNICFMYSNVWNTIRLPSQVIVRHPVDILSSLANTSHPAYWLDCSAIQPCLNNSGSVIIVTFNLEYYNTSFTLQYFPFSNQTKQSHLVSFQSPLGV